MSLSNQILPSFVLSSRHYNAKKSFRFRAVGAYIPCPGGFIKFRKETGPSTSITRVRKGANNRLIIQWRGILLLGREEGRRTKTLRIAFHVRFGAIKMVTFFFFFKIKFMT